MSLVPFIGISIWVIAKVFVVLALVLYVIFGLVVVRQVQLMIDTLEVGFEAFVRMLAIGHLVFSIVVFALALIIL
jgi:hypothetical protein